MKMWCTKKMSFRRYSGWLYHPLSKGTNQYKVLNVASLKVVSSLALEVREEFIWDCKLEGLLRRCLTSCKNIQLSSWSSSSTSSVFFSKWSSSSDHHPSWIFVMSMRLSLFLILLFVYQKCLKLRTEKMRRAHPWYQLPVGRKSDM